MFNTTINTKYFGLLGNPLGQSAAAFMHNSVYQKMGLDALFIPLELDMEDFGAVLTHLEKFRFRGTGVTMPFKTQAHKYLDGLADSSRYSQVVNTVVIDGDGRKIGHNTDGVGFVRSLKEQFGMNIPDHRYLILGSGGAATAIACALAADGAGYIRSLCLASDYFCAETLFERVEPHFPGVCGIEEMTDKTMARHIGECDVIIHATKVGMHPKCDDILFDPDLLTDKHYVADVVYVPVYTKLLEEAEKRGSKTLTGLWMNVYQAAEQMRLWLGIEPPIEFMYQSGLDHLAKENKLRA